MRRIPEIAWTLVLFLFPFLLFLVVPGSLPPTPPLLSFAFSYTFLSLVVSFRRFFSLTHLLLLLPLALFQLHLFSFFFYFFSSATFL
jgi:hypothetical protein